MVDPGAVGLRRERVDDRLQPPAAPRRLAAQLHADAHSGCARAGGARRLHPALDVKQIPQDTLWKHTRGIWLLDLGMLVALSVLYTAVVRWKIRLKR